MDYKERMITELEDLTIKIDRLAKYISITEETRLEKEQLQAMEVYKHWLEQRILKLMGGNNEKESI